MEDDIDIEEIQVGEGDGTSCPVIPADFSSETLVARARKNAQSLGLKVGINPLYRMTTPKGRNVGFPFPSPRPFQLEAVDAALDSLDAGHDVLFEAGTGVGKSPIAMAIASYFDSSWLLVGRNDLVDQWERDFSSFEEIGFYKARGRFTCLNSDFGTDGVQDTCAAKSECASRHKRLHESWTEWDRGGRKGTEPRKPSPCPYATNRDLSLDKPHTAMTLSLGLTIFTNLFGVHPMVDKRKILVVDECSELESELMKHHQCTISTKTIKRVIPFNVRIGDLDVCQYNMASNLGLLDAIRAFEVNTLAQAIEWCKWIDDILFKGLKLRLAMRKGQMEGANEEDTAENEREEKEIKQEVENVRRQIKTMLTAIETGLPYGFERRDDVNWRTKAKTDDWQIILSPLEARGLIDRMLSSMADRIVYVSATTGPSANWMATHGLKRPVAHISMPSPFPVENRPVHSFAIGNMSQKTIEQDMPKIMATVVKLATHQSTNPTQNHANQSGVIHTYNNKITDATVEALRRAGLEHRTLVLRGGGLQREAIMQEFKTGRKPYILVSPSAMLGLSLNDDIARWQAIIKMPYPNLGEQSVKHRMDNIPGWYDWQVAKDLIQTFGRVVRSPTDWGITYVLDAGFQGFYRRNKHLFPAYVQAAIATH